MLTAARNGFAAGKHLPYEAEVEYLESTGTQWIDTGIIYTGGRTIYFDVVLAPFTTYGNVIADYRDENTKTTRIIWGPSSSQAIIYNNSYTPGSILDSRMVVGVGADRHLAGWISTTDCFCNGTSWGVRGPWIKGGTQPNQSIILWGGWDKTIHKPVAFALSGTRISRFAIEGICDFISVRFTNEQGQTEGAMFDRANPTVGMNPDGSARTDGLYRNRGTGAFVIGPDKSAANGGGYKPKCVRRSYRRSLRLSARFWRTRLWKEVA